MPFYLWAHRVGVAEMLPFSRALTFGWLTEGRCSRRDQEFPLSVCRLHFSFFLVFFFFSYLSQKKKKEVEQRDGCITDLQDMHERSCADSAADEGIVPCSDIQQERKKWRDYIRHRVMCQCGNVLDWCAADFIRVERWPPLHVLHMWVGTVGSLVAHWLISLLTKAIWLKGLWSSNWSNARKRTKVI